MLYQQVTSIGHNQVGAALLREVIYAYCANKIVTSG